MPFSYFICRLSTLFIWIGGITDSATWGYPPSLVCIPPVGRQVVKPGYALANVSYLSNSSVLNVFIKRNIYIQSLHIGCYLTIVHLKLRVKFMLMRLVNGTSHFKTGGRGCLCEIFVVSAGSLTSCRCEERGAYPWNLEVVGWL